MNLLDDRLVHDTTDSRKPSPLTGHERRTRSLAALIVLVAIASTWLLSGVSISEAVRFAAFEGFYVLLPGLLAYAVLSVEPGGWLRSLAIGVPLGYAINTGAFALAASLGARAAFAFLPLASLALSAPILMRRRRRRRAGAWKLETAGGGTNALIVALAIAAALTILALTFFASTPLPANAHSVVYTADNVFDISLAAEARNHWPITEPWVAGQPLRYYTAAFIHVAAVNQVAGVALATVILRLLPATMLIVVALQLWFLGSSLGYSSRVGPIAVVLLLVVEDLNLNPTQSQVFHISPFTQFPLSPTFAFGAPFLLGAIALLGPRLADTGVPAPLDRRRHIAAPGSNTGAGGMLAMLGILVLGAASAKMFAAADLLGGLSLYWLWRAIAGRPSRLVTHCLALSTVCVAVVYFAMLAGGGSASMHLAPFAFVQDGDSFTRARAATEGVAGHTLYWIPLLLGGAVLAIFLLTPLLGGVWLLRRRNTVPPAAGLCVAVFLAGALGYLLLGAPGGVEGVFLIYGYIAVLPLAALGLAQLWQDTPPAARVGLAKACAALLALGLSIAAITPGLALTGHAADAWHVLTYALVAGAIALTAVRLRGCYAPTLSSRSGRTVACAIPLLLTLGLVKPAALTASGAWKTLAHEQIAVRDSSSDYGLTAALYAGLLWVRDHTNRCDVLAVNNHFSEPSDSEADYVYYSAFTERRVFLESWFYTPQNTLGGALFPGRRAVNDRAVAGDPEALRELASDGVSYILIDKLHGSRTQEPPSVSRLVFRNSALDVYRLLATERSAGQALGCGSVG